MMEISRSKPHQPCPGAPPGEVPPTLSGQLPSHHHHAYPCCHHHHSGLILEDMFGTNRALRRVEGFLHLKQNFIASLLPLLLKIPLKRRSLQSPVPLKAAFQGDIWPCRQILFMGGGVFSIQAIIHRSSCRCAVLFFQLPLLQEFYLIKLHQYSMQLTQKHKSFGFRPGLVYVEAQFFELAPPHNRICAASIFMMPIYLGWERRLSPYE